MDFRTSTKLAVSFTGFPGHPCRYIATIHLKGCHQRSSTSLPAKLLGGGISPPKIWQEKYAAVSSTCINSLKRIGVKLRETRCEANSPPPTVDGSELLHLGMVNIPVFTMGFYTSKRVDNQVPTRLLIPNQLSSQLPPSPTAKEKLRSALMTWPFRGGSWSTPAPRVNPETTHPWIEQTERKPFKGSKKFQTLDSWLMNP